MILVVSHWGILLGKFRCIGQAIRKVRLKTLRQKLRLQSINGISSSSGKEPGGL